MYEYSVNMSVQFSYLMLHVQCMEYMTIDEYVLKKPGFDDRVDLVAITFPEVNRACSDPYIAGG